MSNQNNSFSMEKLEYAKKDFDLSKGLFIGQAANLIDTEEDVTDIYVDWKSLAGHTVVFGTTRVGKTRLMMAFVRQIILNKKDLFLVDPKGSFGQEIYAWILEFAEEAGRLRDVKYISPLFPSLSIQFNPLYYLSNSEIASSIATLIDSKDEFFANMGYEIVMAICLALEYIEKARGSEKSKQLISEEYERYVKQGNIVDQLNKILDPDLATRVVNPSVPLNLNKSIPPLRNLVTFSDLATYSTKEGLEVLKTFVENINTELMGISTEEMKSYDTLKGEALKALNEQISKPNDYFNKVASSYNLVLSQLGTDAIGNILSTTKINPIVDMLYRKDHGNIFFIQPFPMLYKKASDNFIKVIFSMLTSLYGRIGATGRKLPREVFLAIDEGGSVLYPGVEALFNKAGGLGLRIMIFTQAFSDFDAVVGQDLSRIISDNTNIKIYLRMNDEASRLRVSQAFGTVKKIDNSHAGSVNDFRTTIRYKEEEVLTSAHVSDLPEQHFMFQHGGRKFLIKGPFVPDPCIQLEAPEIKAELMMTENFTEMIKGMKILEKKEIEKNTKELQEIREDLGIEEELNMEFQDILQDSKKKNSYI